MSDKDSTPSSEQAAVLSPHDRVKADSEKFLKETLAHEPTRKSAKRVFQTYIKVLKTLDIEGWKRFFDLQRNKEKPVEYLENAAVAAVHPADYAYVLLKRLQELDKAWWKRYGKRISYIFAVPLIGTATKYVVENWDTVWEILRGVLGLVLIAVLVTYWLSFRKR
jgi:hypothetical protein